MLPTITLEQLLPGTTAQVIDLVGQPSNISRFFEIGIRVGAQLQMLQAGTACVVRVNGSKLCVRSRGVTVVVQPC